MLPMDQKLVRETAEAVLAPLEAEVERLRAEMAAREAELSVGNLFRLHAALERIATGDEWPEGPSAQMIAREALDG